MSRRGNCYDNAVMESWFSTVKSEEAERFESYAHAKEALFDYSMCSITSGVDTRRSARLKEATGGPESRLEEFALAGERKPRHER
jgi:transposase InsO family protein